MSKHKVKLLKVTKRRSDISDFTYDAKVEVDDVEITVKAVLAWSSRRIPGTYLTMPTGRIQDDMVIRVYVSEDVKKHPDFSAISKEIRSQIKTRLGKTPQPRYEGEHID